VPPRYAAAAAALALAGVSACVAPQHPGFERVAYTSMATVDGGFLGAVGGIAVCSVLGGGEYAPDGLIKKCAIAGTVVGAPLALYGTLQADKPPELQHWLTVPVIPAIYAIWGVAKLAGWD
jgi:hypothetical protein